MTGSVWKNMDKPLLLVYLLLVAAGWFNIYSVVYDPESMAGFSLATRYGKQLVFIGFAVLLAAFVGQQVISKFHGIPKEQPFD